MLLEYVTSQCIPPGVGALFETVQFSAGWPVSALGALGVSGAGGDFFLGNSWDWRGTPHCRA